MALKDPEVAELKKFFPNLSRIEVGENEMVLISPLILPQGCNPRTVDALLCPFTRDGYTSRLFLSVKVDHTGPGKNWNADGVIIAGRKWWAVSWKTNRDDLTLREMLLTHLDAFK